MNATVDRPPSPLESLIEAEDVASDSGYDTDVVLLPLSSAA